jgi:hypothetical protein
VIIESFGFLCRKKPITLTFFLNLFNELAFAYCVAKLKLFASISALRQATFRQWQAGESVVNNEVEK